MAEHVSARLEALGTRSPLGPATVSTDVVADDPDADGRDQHLIDDAPATVRMSAATAGRPPRGPAASEVDSRDSDPAGVKGRLTAAAISTPAFVRSHLAVVAAVVFVGVAATGYFVFQTRAESVAVGVTTAAETPPPDAASASPDGGSPTAAVASPSPTAIRVHVLGAVSRPGVVAIPDGSRVGEAVTAAGGFTADADPAELNLAAVVPDGAQIVIGTKASPRGEVNVSSAGGRTVGGSGESDASLDLNTATQEQLEALPGIGPVTAQKIVAWRSAHGRFTRVEDLLDVSGIGDKTLEEIRPHVRV